MLLMVYKRTSGKKSTNKILTIVDLGTQNDMCKEYTDADGIKCVYTVKSHKIDVLETRGLFRIISISNFREVDIKYMTSKMIIISLFSL